MQGLKTYGDGAMSVTAEEFSTWTFKVSKMFLDGMAKERNAKIVQTGFCRMRFINDSCYPSGYKHSKMKRCSQPQEKNVSFVQLSSPGSSSELKDYQSIAAGALPKMDIGEESYIYYGSDYSFA